MAVYGDILFHEVIEAREKNYKNDKLVKCAWILFLTNLHQNHHVTLVISESTMMQDYDIGKYLRYMTENYSTVTLKSMAEQFNFHPVYFSKLFKELSGYTFTYKLLMIKLEHAKRLLITTDLSVSEIVELIGFKEKSHFYRSFRKYYQMTPNAYRKSQRG